MGAQLSIFAIEPVSDQGVSISPMASSLDDHRIAEFIDLVSRIHSIYGDLRANREYVMFTKTTLKASNVLGRSVQEIAEQITKRNFVAKLELAKRELTEISSWLALLKRGHLLKGDYENYDHDVTELLGDLHQALAYLRNRSLSQAA